MSRRFKDVSEHVSEKSSSRSVLSTLTIQDLKNIKVAIRRPYLPETASVGPTQRGLENPDHLHIHRRGEGQRPLFAREDIRVNVEEHLEERIVLKSPLRETSNRSRSNSYSDRGSYRRSYSRSSSKESKKDHKKSERNIKPSTSRRTRSPQPSTSKGSTNRYRSSSKSPKRRYDKSTRPRTPPSPRRKRTHSPYTKKRTPSPHFRRSPHREHRSSRSRKRSTSPYDRSRSNAAYSRHSYSRRRSGSPYSRRRSPSPYRSKRRSRSRPRGREKSRSPSHRTHRYLESESKHKPTVEEVEYMGLPAAYSFYGGEGYWIPGPVPRPGFMPKGIPSMGIPRGMFRPAPPYILQRPYIPMAPHMVPFRQRFPTPNRNYRPKGISHTATATTVSSNVSVVSTDTISTVTAAEEISAPIIEESTSDCENADSTVVGKI